MHSKAKQRANLGLCKKYNEKGGQGKTPRHCFEEEPKTDDENPKKVLQVPCSKGSLIDDIATDDESNDENQHRENSDYKACKNTGDNGIG